MYPTDTGKGGSKQPQQDIQPHLTTPHIPKKNEAGNRHLKSLRLGESKAEDRCVVVVLGFANQLQLDKVLSGREGLASSSVRSLSREVERL